MTTFLTWTELPDKTGHTMTAHSGTWDELVNRVRTVGTFPSKDRCPWIKLASFGNKRSKGGSLRTNENVAAVYGLELDYDGEVMSIEDARDKLESFGIKAALYPSPSSTPQKPRWRVICPLAEQHTPSARDDLLARVNGVLGGVASSESFTLSQGYFFGATPTNDYRVLVTFEGSEKIGHCVDELHDLDRIAIGKRTKPGPNDPGKASTNAPVGIEMFEAAVASAGGLLASGDGRRELLKSYIASRSARGLPADDIRLLIDGIAARYFDPADPLDEKNIGEIIKHFASKDANRHHDDGEFIDPETGETVKVHPLARFVDVGGSPKPPRWVIPGFVGHGVTVISGAAGVGKTTAILPLSMTAAGLHGGDMKPCEWRHVVYVTEDLEQAQRILAGIVEHGDLGIRWEQVRERLHLVEAVRLDPAFVAQVGKTYRERFTRTVNGLEVLPLVVLDTKSAVLALENENDNSEASRMMAALKQGFEGLPVWLVGHVAKNSIGRSDVATLTSRGAGATEGDGNQTMFLVIEGDSRFLVLGKVRFEPRWRELAITAQTASVFALDEFGNPEEVTMRWGIAGPAQQSRKDASELAAEQRRGESDAALRQEVVVAVDIAWIVGNPLNRAGVKSEVRRKASDVGVMVDTLLAESWLYEVTVPAKLRLVNSRGAFLVSLTQQEREAVLRGGSIPADKLEIPASWCKTLIPPVPAKNSTLGAGQ